MISKSTAINWLPGIELLCATLAATLWYLLPHVGPWPLALVLVPWGVQVALTGRIKPATHFDAPLLLFLLSAGIGVWAAYDREVAWSRFWLIVAGVSIFYALANAESLSGARLGLVAFFGAGLTLYYLATHDWQLMPAKIGLLTRLGRALQAPLPKLPDRGLNPNEVGGILAMSMPFAAGTALLAWQKIRPPLQRRSPVRWLIAGAALGALALVFLGLLMSTSRGAWIAAGSALLLASSWLVVRRWRGIVRRRTWLALGLGLLLLSAAAGMTVYWLTGLAATNSGLLDPQTLFDRLGFQRNSLTLVRDYPLIGAGLGGFQMLYSTYVLLIHVGFIPHSHNLFLNVAIDQGLPGLLALIWLWVVFGRLLYRDTLAHAPTRSSWTPATLAAGLAACSLLIVLIHGMVSNALYSREGILLLFAPLAFVARSRPEQQHQQIGHKYVWGLLLCLGIAFGFVLVERDEIGSLVHSNLGAVFQSQAELGVYHWPEWSIQDAVRQNVDLGPSLSEFRRALVLNPLNATANRRLGMIELSLGAYEDALHHLETAFRVEPWCETTRRLLGEAFAVNGQVDEGQVLWAGVDDAQRQFELRTFWYESIGDEQRAAWIRRAANGR